MDVRFFFLNLWIFQRIYRPTNVVIAILSVHRLDGINVQLSGDLSCREWLIPGTRDTGHCSSASMRGCTVDQFSQQFHDLRPQGIIFLQRSFASYSILIALVAYSSEQRGPGTGLEPCGYCTWSQCASRSLCRLSVDNPFEQCYGIYLWTCFASFGSHDVEVQHPHAYLRRTDRGEFARRRRPFCWTPTWQCCLRLLLLPGVTGQPIVPSPRLFAQQIKHLITGLMASNSDQLHHVVFSPALKDRIKATRAKRGRPTKVLRAFSHFQPPAKQDLLSHT